MKSFPGCGEVLRIASKSYAIIVSKCGVGAHTGSLLLGMGYEQVMQ